MKRHGISCEGKYAVQLKRSDYEKYDIFLLMDENNMRSIARIFPDDPLGKVHKLLEFAGRNGDVSDPWYTRDFSAAYNDILDGCMGLLKTLK